MSPSAGKSSLVLAQQAKWRCMYNHLSAAVFLFSTENCNAAHGLWGQAKFQEIESAPFASLVRARIRSHSLYSLSLTGFRI